MSRKETSRRLKAAIDPIDAFNSGIDVDILDAFGNTLRALSALRIADPDNKEYPVLLEEGRRLQEAVYGAMADDALIYRGIALSQVPDPKYASAAEEVATIDDLAAKPVSAFIHRAYPVLKQAEPLYRDAA